MKLYFLLAPFLCFFILSWFPEKTWILPSSLDLFRFLALFGYFATLAIYRWENQSQQFWQKIPKLPIFAFGILLLGIWIWMIAFPLRDLRFGDGILLLETNYWETKLFGIQTTLDELGEAITHSAMRHVLEFFIPQETQNSLSLNFQVASWFSGFLFLVFAGILVFKKNQSSLLFVLGSGGLFLFFGYAENYTITTLLLFFTIYTIAEKSQQIQLHPKRYLAMSTALVVLCMLFHLVSGHLAIVLFYLWLQVPRISDKVKSFFLCSFLGLIVLGFAGGYFLYFHDPRIDLQSTHLVHPPIYPWKRMVSTQHFWEIFQVILWNAFLPFWGIAYAWFFCRSEFEKLWTSLKARIYFISILAFLIHAFRHNPMLGFPADWDLMGFVWIPLLLFAIFLAQRISFFPILLPHFAFSFCILILLSLDLSKPKTHDQELLQQTKMIVDEFLPYAQQRVLDYATDQKKFGTKMDYFFFKMEKRLKASCPNEQQKALLVENFQLESTWVTKNQSQLFLHKKEMQDFIGKATTHHTEVLKFLEGNRRCRL